MRWFYLAVALLALWMSWSTIKVVVDVYKLLEVRHELVQ